MSEHPQPSLLILQAVFGGILVLLGMFMITPIISWSISTQAIAVVVGILCLKDGLMQLAAAFLVVVKKD